MSDRIQVQFQAWVDGQWKKVGKIWLNRDMVPPVGDQIIVTVYKGRDDKNLPINEDFQYVVKERIWSLFGPQYGVIIVVEEATQ